MDVRLCVETLFDDPDLFGCDLGMAARRARLLAWSYEQFCTTHFSTTSDNEFAWQLGEMYLAQVAALLDKAAAASEGHHKARHIAAHVRSNEAWESFFRDHLRRAGYSGSAIEAELANAKFAVGSVSVGA